MFNVSTSLFSSFDRMSRSIISELKLSTLLNIMLRKNNHAFKSHRLNDSIATYFIDKTKNNGIIVKVFVIR